MSKTIIGAQAGDLDFFDSSSTTARWWTLAGTGNGAGVTGVAKTEVIAQWKIGVAGTLADLGFSVLTNTNTASATVNSRVNTANGNQTVSIGGSATGAFADATHSDTLAAGDIANWQYGPLGFLKHVQMQGLALFSFNGSSTVASAWHVVGDLNSGGVTFNNGTASTTTYLPPIGGTAAISQTTEASVQIPARSAGTLQRGGIRVQTNTSTNAMSVALRIGGSNGNTALSIGASSTGLIEDTTHTDAVTTASLVSWGMTSGAGTVNATVNWLGLTFTSSATNWDFRIAKSNNTDEGWVAATTYYVATSGALGSVTSDPAGGISALESKVQSKTPFAMYLDRMLAVRIAVSGQSTASTATSRVNTAAGAQSLSLTSNTTGTYEDSTHIDSLVAADLFNFSFVKTNGTTDTINVFGARGDTTNPTPATGRSRRVFTIFG